MRSLPISGLFHAGHTQLFSVMFIKYKRVYQIWEYLECYYYTCSISFLLFGISVLQILLSRLIFCLYQHIRAKYMARLHLDPPLHPLYRISTVSKSHVQSRRYWDSPQSQLACVQIPLLPPPISVKRGKGLHLLCYIIKWLNWGRFV